MTTIVLNDPKWIPMNWRSDGLPVSKYETFTDVTRWSSKTCNSHYECSGQNNLYFIRLEYNGYHDLHQKIEAVQARQGPRVAHPRCSANKPKSESY